MILQIRVPTFLSRWKLSKFIDQNESLINHLLYNIPSLESGIFWIFIIFDKILKFPGYRLELLPSVFLYYLVKSIICENFGNLDVSFPESFHITNLELIPRV